MEIKKFDLNIEKILEDWDIHHAIREIIANAIDECIITNTKDIDISKDNSGKWHIRDFGRGLKYEHLTQKENDEKLRNPKVIGKFGIGLKDALATFDRKGVKILIKSRYGDITISKSEKHDFKDIVTLHADIHLPLDPNFVGTEFIIEGCSDSDIENAKDLFLIFSGDKVLEDTEYGKVLEKKEDVGRIYINGVKIAEEVNFLFSYNITRLNSAIKRVLNRERTNVGRTAYSGIVKSILLSCKSKVVAERLVDDLKGYQTGSIHDEVNWTDVSIYACRLLNSFEKTVFFTSSELIKSNHMVDEARREGYKIVTIPDSIREKIRGESDVSGNPIRDLDRFSTEYIESFVYEFIEEKDMSHQEREIFKMTGEIFNLMGGKPQKIVDVKISKTMRKDVSALTPTVGVWDSLNGWIIVHISQLRNIKIYAGTLLHEAAHAVSNHPDVDRIFELELSSMIGTIVSKFLDMKTM